MDDFPSPQENEQISFDILSKSYYHPLTRSNILGLPLSFNIAIKVGAYLLIIFLVVMLIDLVSIYLRSFFTDESENTKPTWSDVFIPPATKVGRVLDIESSSQLQS